MAAQIDENIQYTDPSTGELLNNGYIYIGADGLDAKLNPITIYADRELTIPLSSTQRIGSDGRALNKIWVSGKYSMKVENYENVQKLNDLSLGDTNQAVDSYDNIAALRAITYAPLITHATIKGYYTDGDGGGGNFYWDSTSTDTDDGGITIKATTITTGRWKRLYSGAINVKWFGAKGDGVTGDTSAIQAAIDACSASGGVIYVPIGSYLITATLNVNYDGLSIRGGGKGSVITRSSNFGHTISVAEISGTTWIRDFEISNIYLESTSVLTNGAHISIDGLLTGKITDVYMKDGFTGLQLASVHQLNVDNLYVLFDSVPASGTRYILNIPSANAGVHEHSGDVFFTNFNGRGGSTSQCEYGVEIRSCDGLFFSNSHIGNCLAANLLIDGTTAAKCTGILFSNTWFDIGDGRSVQIEGTAGANSNYTFSGCTFLGSTNNTDAIFINGSAVNGILINDCNITGFHGHGINLTANFVNEIFIKDNRIRSNGLTSGYGILYTGDCAATITGNVIRGASHIQGIGISGSKALAVIDNNILYGNIASMGILSGTVISQKDNIGFNPSGQPTTVTVGASPYTYTNPYGFDLSVWITGSNNVARNSISMPGFVSGEVTLGPGDSVTLTYTGTPTVKIWGI